MPSVHRVATAGPLGLTILAVTAVTACAGGYAGAGTPATDEAVLLRMAPSQGQVSRYRMVMEMWMESSMMPVQDSGPTMRQELYVTHTVTGVEGDTFRISNVLDSADVRMPAMMANVLPDLDGMEYRMTMDARGTILDSKVVEETVPALLREMSQGIGEAMKAQSMELPVEPVKPGHSWETTQETTLSMGPMDATSVTKSQYQLVRLERREGMPYAVLSVSGHVDMVMGDPESPMGTFAGAIHGEVILDLDHGRILSHETSSTIEGQVGVGGGPRVPMLMTSKQRLELLRQ